MNELLLICCAISLGIAAVVYARFGLLWAIIAGLLLPLCLFGLAVALILNGGDH